MVHETLDALRHFFGGLVGKRYRQDGVRRHASFLDQVSDPMRNYAGLSRPGPGKDQQRTVHIFNGRTLLRIHIFKQSGHERENSCGGERELDSLAATPSVYRVAVASPAAIS